MGLSPSNKAKLDQIVENYLQQTDRQKKLSEVEETLGRVNTALDRMQANNENLQGILRDTQRQFNNNRFPQVLESVLAEYGLSTKTSIARNALSKHLNLGNHPINQKQNPYDAVYEAIRHELDWDLQIYFTPNKAQDISHILAGNPDLYRNFQQLKDQISAQDRGEVLARTVDLYLEYTTITHDKNEAAISAFANASRESGYAIVIPHNNSKPIAQQKAQPHPVTPVTQFSMPTPPRSDSKRYQYGLVALYADKLKQDGFSEPQAWQKALDKLGPAGIDGIRGPKTIALEQLLIKEDRLNKSYAVGFREVQQHLRKYSLETT